MTRPRRATGLLKRSVVLLGALLCSVPFASAESGGARAASAAGGPSISPRIALPPSLAPGAVLKILVPEAVGAKVVVGNLTSDDTADSGYVTAFDCGARPLASDLNTKAGDIRFKQQLDADRAR